MRAQHRLVPALSAAVAVLVLAACTGGAEPVARPEADADAAGTAVEHDDDATDGIVEIDPVDDDTAPGGLASRFLGCLTSGGLTARMGTTKAEIANYLLFVQVDDTPADTFIETRTVEPGQAADSPRRLLLSVSDHTGTWDAAAGSGHFEDIGRLDIADVYAACEAEHPGFAQAERTATEAPGAGGFTAQSMEANLPFAQAARAAGMAWVPDPSEEHHGTITLPPTITEAEFTALIELAIEHGDDLVSFRIAPDSPALRSFDPAAVLTRLQGPYPTIAVLTF